MRKVIWLTGISGSGKTTLGRLVYEKFKSLCKRVEFLDGDIVRDFFENDLGYSRRERILNVKRIAFAAMLLAKNDVTVIVANIAPYYEVRDFIRKNIPNYIQVYIKASLDSVRKRDVKGLYGNATNNMVGIDDAYDIPRNPDITVDTDRESVEESLNKILEHLLVTETANAKNS
ncbi:MAG: adenylyl-sulfate kinase [Candidatus Margulisbacteria bacterium]|nr:adenylyl-sulfate kinase [Candidatus Margulisiibacteriota bacterium]